MWRRKKLVLVAVATVVVLAGVLSGVVLAADNGDDDQAGAPFGAVWDKVCAIYEQNTGVALDSAALEDAFDQAQQELRTEAMQSRLQSLVDEGKLTQEQADQYQAWLQSKPDMTQYQQQLRDWQQARPGMPSEVEEWQQAKPEVPFGFGFGGHEGFGGMGGRHGFGGLCPQSSS